MNSIFLTPIIFFLILNGCSNKISDPLKVENDYGESVRKMQESQIYDVRTLRQSPSKQANKLDGSQANKTIQSYRKRILKTPIQSENKDSNTKVNSY